MKPSNCLMMHCPSASPRTSSCIFVCIATHTLSPACFLSRVFSLTLSLILSLSRALARALSLSPSLSLSFSICHTLSLSPFHSYTSIILNKQAELNISLHIELTGFSLLPPLSCTGMERQCRQLPIVRGMLQASSECGAYMHVCWHRVLRTAR